MTGAGATPSALPAHQTNDCAMVARSNPVFDAVCMARELTFRVGNDAASKITREAPVAAYYSTEEIRVHGEDFLKMVLARIAFANTVRTTATEWTKRNNKNKSRMQKLFSSTKSQDFFRPDEFQKQGRPIMEAVLLFLKETMGAYLSCGPHTSFQRQYPHQSQAPPGRHVHSALASPTVQSGTLGDATSSQSAQLINYTSTAAVYGVAGQPNPPAIASSHAGREGLSTRRVVSEPRNLPVGIPANSALFQPSLSPSLRQGFGRHTSGPVPMQPHFAHASNPHNPPFFPEQLAPTLHGQMLRNNLAQFHGIPIMHMPPGAMPTLTPFMPGPALQVYPMMANLTASAMPGSVACPGATAQYHSREHSDTARATQPRGNKGRTPRLVSETNAPRHSSSWRIKQSPPARRFSDPRILTLEPESIPVTLRITKDSIGQDVEHVYKLWVHGIPQAATVTDIQRFFEETVAVSKVRPIMTDKNNVNYTYAEYVAISRVIPY